VFGLRLLEGLPLTEWTQSYPIFALLVLGHAVGHGPSANAGISDHDDWRYQKLRRGAASTDLS